MNKSYSKENNQFIKEELATGDELDREVFPQLYNLSSAFFYQYICRPLSKAKPEFVYIPCEPYENMSGHRRDVELELEVAINKWNYSWEANRLRQEMFKGKLPFKLKWLEKYTKANLYLIPDFNLRYDAYLPLYHMLPQCILKSYNLPLFRKGMWPPAGFAKYWRLIQLTSDFDNRLAKAFAHHIWPLLNHRSKINAFSKDDPVVILSHNLNYWLPYAYSVVEERLRSFPRADCDNIEQERELIRLRRKMPTDVKIDRPLKGGTIWSGEDDAWNVTKELVALADKKGKLREIIDAIRANRIEDDFSSRWTYEREDFERKLYKKRSKTKVSFVQLDDTIPVHAPSSELDDDLLWEDFISILDKKEKRVVVCLRNGITKVGEIGKLLGYASHSPVSKTLARIRRKAKQYLELD